LTRTCAAFLLLALSSSVNGHAQPPAAARERVVLLSIDGLKPDYVLEAGVHGLKVPHLRRLVADGAFATGVTGVFPTVTYPSHTTLLTGVSPSVHGILANGPFDPQGRNADGWFWYAEDVKVPTLWDVAGEKGLVTANVDWPVSVGARVRYNIAQYWRAAVEEDHKLLRALSTPGLLDEAERTLGPYPAGYQYTLPDDGKRARFAAWMIEAKRPDFLTVYMSSLDEAQHHSGAYSRETFETLEGLDTLVGEVRAAADRAFPGLVTFAVVSDHGHVTTDKALHLNAALREAGLVDVDAQQRVTAWRAFAWNEGGSAAIVLEDPADAVVRERVRSTLRRVADDPANGVARVLEEADLRALGGYSTASFAVDLKPGFRTGNDLAGPLVRPVTPGGTHGYAPTLRDMQAAFFIVGKGIPAGRNLGTIDMRDIAPTLATRLGLALPRAQGKNRL